LWTSNGIKTKFTVSNKRQNCFFSKIIEKKICFIVLYYKLKFLQQREQRTSQRWSYCISMEKTKFIKEIYIRTTHMRKELKLIIEIKPMTRIVHNLVDFWHLIGKNDSFCYIQTVINPMNKWVYIFSLKHKNTTEITTNLFENIFLFEILC
jgi:hypothetical protein